jgi:hypothetical protein
VFEARPTSTLFPFENSAPLAKEYFHQERIFMVDESSFSKNSTIHLSGSNTSFS